MTDAKAVHKPILDVQTAGERETYEGFLDYLRGAIVRKATGLSEEDARRRMVDSDTTIGGLVKHLRYVEQTWFAEVIAGLPANDLEPYPWTDDDPDADFRLEQDEPLAEAIERYQQQCARSKELAAKFDLDHTGRNHRGNPVSLRWVYVHMIEETGRHAGHADILREQIDGAIGD